MSHHSLTWHERGAPVGIEFHGLSDLAVQAMAEGLRQSVGISDVHVFVILQDRSEL